MPIYQFQCNECGPFTAMRPMARFRDPCLCPACGAGAPRVLVSVPGVVRAGSGGKDGRRTPAAHPAGCGCCARRWTLPGAPSAIGGRIFTSSGPVRRADP